MPLIDPEKKKIYNQRYYEKTREKQLIYNRTYYEINRNKILQNQKTKGKKNYNFMNWIKLGIKEDRETMEYIYDVLYLPCKRCWVCGHDFSKYRKCLDHCHESGKFRQVLCHYCNTCDMWKKHSEFV